MIDYGVWRTVSARLYAELLSNGAADASHSPQKAELQEPVRYYEAAEPPTRAAVGGSDFLRAVSNVDITAALNVLDELMSALYVANPKVYNGVMRKLERLQDE